MKKSKTISGLDADNAAYPSVAAPVDPNKDTSAFSVGAKRQLQAVGSSGTEVYAGYFSEEYLQSLRGSRGAKVYDEMRRSDSQIAMLMAAVNNPIKAATWAVKPFGVAPEAEKHAEFIRACLFDMIDWETFVHEALTCVPFGFSLFEIVHSVVVNHPKFGTVNGLKALGWRSQKTIESWKLEQGTGKLLAVDQYVYSDVGRNVVIPGDFLVCVTNQKEGDNYEGIPAIRPMYGPWSRKNLYLKLTAIAVEKYSVGVPVGKIPKGMEKSADAARFHEVLGSFVSHEAAYITVPEGWEIEILSHEFDAAKIKELLLFENSEMVNALVANFLLLGLNGSGGAYSLGQDLSDFFLNGIQAYARLIASAINRKVIPDLVKLNFGEQPGYPKLEASGIADNAGKELAETAQILAGAKIIQPDMKLEDYFRERYKLPKTDPTTTREAPAPVAPAPMQFADRLALSEGYVKAFDKNKTSVKDEMLTGLKALYASLKESVRRAYNAAGPSNKVKAVVGLTVPGLGNYRAALKETFAAVAYDAVQAAKREVPASVRLSESMKLAAPRGGYFAALPPKVRRLVEAQAALISSSQLADLEKIAYFTYASGAGAEIDLDAILTDMDAAIMGVIEGEKAGSMSLDAAAGNAVAQVTNQARMDFFFEPDVLDEIESFTFENDDPISDICQALDGHTFDKNDPALSQYQPPLHHNCKSRLVPNLVGKKNNPAIDRNGVSVSEKALKSMTLSEAGLSDPKGDIQSIVISKKHSPTLDAAKEALVKFGGTFHKVDETLGSWRFRQKSPDDFEDEGYRTFQPVDGVSIVYGTPKAKA